MLAPRFGTRVERQHLWIHKVKGEGRGIVCKELALQFSLVYLNVLAA